MELDQLCQFNGFRAGDVGIDAQEKQRELELHPVEEQGSGGSPGVWDRKISKASIIRLTRDTLVVKKVGANNTFFVICGYSCFFRFDGELHHFQIAGEF